MYRFNKAPMLLRALLAALLLFSLQVPEAYSGGDTDAVVMVLNTRNPTKKITEAQVKRIYMGNLAFWNGVVPIKVYTRSSSEAASEQFYGDILKMKHQSFDSHWSSRELAGQGVAPTVAHSPTEVAEFVRSTPGGIGFLLASEVWDITPDGVQVLEIQ